MAQNLIWIPSDKIKCVVSSHLNPGHKKHYRCFLACRIKTNFLSNCLAIYFYIISSLSSVMDYLKASMFSFCRFWCHRIAKGHWTMLKSLSCSFTWSVTSFRHSVVFSSMCHLSPIPLHHIYQLVLFTQVLVESWIHVIYANFSTHHQHVRTETRIC